MKASVLIRGGKKIEILAVAKSVRIYINGSLHIMFKQDELISIQSWVESTNLFFIEIQLKGATMKCEYDSAERWTKILNLLDETL